MLRFLFLFLFIIFSILHLRDSWRDDAAARAKTKPFLLIFLALYYAVSSHNILIPLLVALLASWLGDVLLIPRGNGWFTAGGIAFLVCHASFVITYTGLISFENQPWLLIVPLAAVYFGIAFKVIAALKDTTPNVMRIPMYFYLIANSTMNLFALMQLFSVKNALASGAATGIGALVSGNPLSMAGAVVAYIGAVLFFISDCTLYLVRYHRDHHLIFKRHFTVMLTYLAGEFLITQGILMLRG